MNYLILSRKWTASESNHSAGHAIWWGKNQSGYTADINSAGRYTHDDAKAIADGCGDDVAIYTEAEVLAMPARLIVDVAHTRRAKPNNQGYRSQPGADVATQKDSE